MFRFATPALTAKFSAAVRRSHRVVSKVEVWHANSMLADLGKVTGGNVSVDETRSIRRTLKLTVNSQGLEYDDLVPDGSTSLLNPGTGNELRVYRGIDFQDGTDPAYVPLGVFRMTKPTVKDTGDAITISVGGQDRGALVARIKWLDPYVIQGGADLSTAIRKGIATRLPAGLNQAYNLMPTSPVPGTTQYLTVAPQTFGSNPAQTNTPWADFTKLASVAGCELLFDPTGTLVLRTVAVITPTTGKPNPKLSPVVMQFVEGQNGVLIPAKTARPLTSVGRSLDETVEYNGCRCIGNGPGGGGPSWQAASTYTVGTVVQPTTANGYYYRAVGTSGKSGTTEPAWPTTVGSTVTDGTVTWYCEGSVPPSTPVQATVWTTTPLNPSWYTPAKPDTSTWGPTPFIFETSAFPAPGQSQATAKAQALAAARAKLQLIRRALDTTTFTCVPDPRLAEGDALGLTRKAVGIESVYVASALTIPLTAVSTMTVTNRPAQEVG